MLSIDEQIANLQKLKAKIEFYHGLADRAILAVEDSSMDRSAMEEVATEVKAFALKMIERITKSTQAEPVLPPPAPKRPEAQPTVEAPIPALQDQPMDPLKFLMVHRDKVGLRCNFKLGPNDASGVVKGCVNPELLIEMDNGQIAKIKPEFLTF